MLSFSPPIGGARLCPQVAVSCLSWFKLRTSIRQRPAYSAIDPELVGEVLQVIESLAKDGMTIIMVTHEMNFARRVSDRVVFMHQGRVHEIGAPAELFTAPRTAELRQFLA